ncbi:MAG: 4-alpha-glucanotransferase [Lachnospiraceae bacterium]
MRRSGILMPITSLPSPYGVGTLGQCARDFICFLEKAGQTYWQILPIGPTGYGDSPYQPSSSYAGNPYMIDLEELTKDHLLSTEEYDSIHWGEQENLVDYGILYEKRLAVLKPACDEARKKLHSEYNRFTKQQSYWLDDYALFMAIKKHYGGVSQVEWPMDIRRREPDAMKYYTDLLQEDILFFKTVQFLFFRQWDALKAFAKKHHILLIGDIPIYIGLDSSDVWAHPEEFQLDKNLLPIDVAGCPPDGFSAEGQLWGNPLFDWKHMKQDGFTWWISRIRYQTQIYDFLRIDHFRGFDSYYAIPASESTACNGVWKKGPGIALFKALKKELGELPIIAEDLGFLTPSVHKLLSGTGFPGMKVLEFAFDSRDTGSGYLPHCYTQNCIVYTGTHDNDTILGWEKTAPKEDIAYAKDYLNFQENEEFNWCMMRTALSSVADTAILQMPDLLNLGSEGRINIPSTIGGNWVWRCLPGDYNDELANRLHHLTSLYGRLPKDETISSK